MNSQGFSFPPPPPPPPSQQQQPQQPQPQQQQYRHHNANYPPQYGGQGYYGQRGGHAQGGHFRGRGRGYGNRGGARGGHFMTPDNRAYPTATPSTGYAQMNYSGYASHPNPATQATPSPSQNFQRAPNASSFPPSQPFTQTAARVPPYQGQPNYGGTYTPPTAQPGSMYPSAMPTQQPVNQPVQTPMVAPPMRWGFEHTGPTGSFAGTQRGGRFNGHNAQSHNGDRTTHYANKRDHNAAFGKPRSVAPRVPAPPPVPSFGNPLPVKPPPPADATRKPKKKKRKHNQLGLTPRTEEHESSEEEDDVDEEARLAGAAANTTALKVTYRGKTSTLQSPEEIAAWIEERRKRYPTQAKVEEKKKAMEEAKKARQEVQRQKDQRKQESKRAQKDGRNKKANDKQPNDQPVDPMDAAAKAKEKADRLRRKLMKEEKRVAKAEADAERALMRAEALQKGSADANIDETLATGQTQPASATGTKADAGSEDKSVKPGPAAAEESGVANGHTTSATDVNIDAGKPEEAGDEVNISSQDDSDSSDWTSSSGSDSSSDESDSDSDSAPEEATSRREGPERVPPPPRENKKKPCHHFARTGRCRNGDKCRFSHETPERGKKAKPTESKGRKGLLQALLDRQKGEEDRKVMEAIAWLGENGFLDAPKDQEEANRSISVTDGAEAPQQAAPKDTISGQETDAAPVTA
ncbi:hypothetical protein CBS147321_6753 [Aspergillus niger]|nr:hypothetical protein CBS133816_10196 [Aspergillus niger]KAI2839951.1 hypothetical protein CBS11350_7289 [Aspergillus niger]KAI2888500.1 hypothetical protein CBS11852_7149 [Aspergillus niger]KAI2921201.1 hypothetical protein CBS147320_7764 [Aspergillus niger]KAI2939473.1 hypothetical protein CBS147321_6753 [Aspergillus niger]